MVFSQNLLISLEEASKSMKQKHTLKEQKRKQQIPMILVCVIAEAFTTNSIGNLKILDNQSIMLLSLYDRSPKDALNEFSKAKKSS